MRWIIGILVLCSALWCGWWLLGAKGTEHVISTWLEDRRGDGWVVNYSGPETRGFPTLFDTTLSAVELADPATGLAMTAPMIELRAAAYSPNEIEAVFPPRLTLASPFERIEIKNETLHASLKVSPDRKLTLQSADIAMSDVILSSTRDWNASVAIGEAAVQQTTGEATYDIEMVVQDFAPSTALRRALDPAGMMPAEIATANVSLQVAFDTAWDLDALEKRRPQPRNVVVKDISAIWGGLELRVSGAFDVNAAGTPTGKLDVRAVNWREMLSLLQENGILPRDLGPLAEAALAGLANASGRPDTLDAVLTLRGGAILFGPIPLGPAPKFVIR